MSKKLFNKVAIVGVGLIGGSLGIAIKRKGLAGEVVGLVRRSKTIKEAVSHKAIDRGTLEVKSAINDADLVVLATPVDTIIEFIPKISKYLKKGCIVTDVGSCKAKIVKTLEKKLPRGVSFVGTHPLAGSERKGVNFSHVDLFKNTVCVLTPTVRTSSLALKKIRRLWQLLGAKIEILSPENHDKVLAFLSHLPHVLAFSLIKSIPAGYLRFSPRSLKDATRIASSDSLLWKDIFLMNSSNILKAINEFQGGLSRLKKLIVQKDGRGILQALQQAKLRRDSL